LIIINYFLKTYQKYCKIYRKLFKKIYFAEQFNYFRRFICPIIIKIKFNNIFNFDLKNSANSIYINKNLKLHLGCGKTHLEDYINIDIRRTKATDYVCDVINLPFPKNSIKLIETYHMIEHLSRKGFYKAIKNWSSILIPGGKIIIELPDFDKAVKEYLDGNEERLNNIFGLQRFKGDVHLYGYNFKRLEQILAQNGFERINKYEPKDYHRLSEPCIRVEAYKVA
jgi:predicted SAM-dependent methyltransferase